MNNYLQHGICRTLSSGEQQQDFYELGNKNPIFRREYNYPAGMDIQVRINGEALPFTQGISFLLEEPHDGIKGAGSLILLCVISKDKTELYNNMISGKLIGQPIQLELITSAIWSDFEDGEINTVKLFDEQVKIKCMSFGVAVDDIVTEYNYTFEIIE